MSKKKKKKSAKAAKTAANTAAPQGPGILAGLGRLLPEGRTEQFLLGLLVGGGLAYVLSDEEIRGKLFKGALKAYAGMAGGLAEMKEQVADLQAEIEAEQSGLL